MTWFKDCPNIDLMEPQAFPAASLATLTRLLSSIEGYADVLRNSLEKQLSGIDNNDSQSTVSALNLPFHANASDALCASQLRVACERISQLVTPPRHLVFEAAGSFYVTMALDVVSKADIATIIEKVSRQKGTEGIPVDVLGRESKLDANLLARLMRHLAVFGIFQEVSLNVFANTAPSATLVNNPEFKAHLDLVMHEGRLAVPFFPELITNQLTASSSHPVSAFSIYSSGQAFYDWLHSPPHVDRNLNFNVAMKGMAHTEGLAFLPFDYPFHILPAEKFIVDVGGGIGTLPTLLLPSLPNHSFIVQDLAPAVNQVTKGEDCFKPQPHEFNGAVFILKNMIHNYPDPEALKILLNLRKSNPHKLLVIDRLVIPHLQSTTIGTQADTDYIPASDPGSQRAATFYDLIMASLHGGRNRTLEEWRELLLEGGFLLIKIYPLRASTGQAVIEAACN
ncbi:S-adenosyl-L-methionine-dependent methyltransferase [Rhodocollybia butyracea]|uniref:S-adenosyl-L-methionine-dependent methyltransferase n=1 Tax=Rhodocollybia butyracea TaxID=206335 RepID=A0A9P5P963_9AGAR|nr:S-adenosyl-L-methionine-dependent methyltransferase [Rhodocollybia butyracea]